MLGLTLDPVCFTIGARPIYWYGVLMALAFAVSLLHLTFVGRRAGHDSAFASDLVFWCMVGGIVGARLAYVAANWEYFAIHPVRIVRMDQGGLIYYGGFFGAGIALWLFAARRGERLTAVMDLIVTALPLGHALGRVGCFLNGCCYGRPSTGAWAVVLDGVARLPVQLFESAGNLILWAALTFVFLRRPRPGTVLGLYCICYSTLRFLLEFQRGDPRLTWGPFTDAQWLSAALFATGLFILLRAQGRTDDHAARGH